MLIDVDSRLNDFTETNVDKTCGRFDVSIVDLINHIDETLTPESLSLGEKWYREAYGFVLGLTYEYAVSEDKAAAVISALSPRMSWIRNKLIARHVISEWAKGTPANEIKGALGANIRMAVAILNGAPISTTLTGIKRKSFYNNIISAGTSDDVTVDTWMQRAAMAVSPEKGMDLDSSLNFLKARNHSGYIAIAHACRTVAKWRNVSPSTVQAAYWIVASGSVHGNHYKGHGKDAVTY